MLVEALATETGSLESDMEMAGGSEAATRPADEAVELYGAVRDGLAGADDELAVQLLHGQAVRGLRATQAARAALEGRPAPGDDSPALEGFCAFDPVHGRASGDVEWEQGRFRPIPACDACAASVASGSWPVARQLFAADGGLAPYWFGVGVEDPVVGEPVCPRWLTAFQ